MTEPVAPIPEPEMVFSSPHAEKIAIAESILMSAGIEYGMRNDHVQDLFGYGRFPNGASLIGRPVELLVAADDAEDARRMLAHLDEPDAEEPGAAPEANVFGLPDAEPDEAGLTTRAARLIARSGKMIALGILIVVALEIVYSMIGNLLAD